MRIHRAPFRFPAGVVGSRAEDILTWVWTSKRELKGATIRSTLSPESARAGLRGETRPYADVSSPTPAATTEQRGARTNERERDWREGRRDSEREKSSPSREKERTLSLSSWGDSAFSKSATSWRHVGRRGSLNGVVHGRHRDGESSSAARITASADEKRLRDGTRKGETRQRKYANCNCKMISERIMQTLSASINIHIFLLLFFYTTST